MKTVLSTSAPKPFTIEPDGDGILLELHLNRIRFGKTSAEWLLQALKKVNHENQILVHDGVTILEVFSASGYTYIMSKNCRFNMTSIVLEKLIEWLETYFSEQNTQR